MAQKRKSRPVRRLAMLAVAMMLAAIIAVPASGMALAQAPDSDNLALVNRDRQMVERKKDGEFIARPVFSRKIDVLHYALRHPDTGEWVTNTYRVRGGEKQLSEGWEYTFEYPVLDSQPELHPEQAFLMVMSVPPRAVATTTSSTPWSPSTSPRGCGTGCWAPWTPTAGLGTVQPG